MPQVNVFKFSEGEGPVMFGVHAAGGILFFGKLAHHLSPEIPFYAIQGKGLNMEDPPFRDLCDLARHYALEITTIHPTGPCCICGRNGAIVLEVGQQMAALGKTAALLVVFDNVAPTTVTPALEDRGAIIRAIAKPYRITQKIFARPGAVAANENRPVVTRPGQYGKALARRVNNRLKQGYNPKKYPGKVLFVRSDEFYRRKSKHHHVQSWMNLCEDLRVQVIPGTHKSMWETPDILGLAALLQTELAAIFPRDT